MTSVQSGRLTRRTPEIRPLIGTGWPQRRQAFRTVGKGGFELVVHSGTICDRGDGCASYPQARWQVLPLRHEVLGDSATSSNQLDFRESSVDEGHLRRLMAYVEIYDDGDAQVAQSSLNSV